MTIVRSGVMVMFAAGCGFQVDAGPGDGSIGDPDAPRVDATSDGGSSDVGPGCFGSSGLATICVATTPPVTRQLSGTVNTDSSPMCEPLIASSDVCAIVAGSIAIMNGNTIAATGSCQHIGHLAKCADKLDAGITRRIKNPQPRKRKQRHLRAVG